MSTAAKGTHVQDSSVLERRLRPIYDWLDSGNYKKAVQECDKVLKKSPNLDRARALKALSLLRQGKEAECVAILDALKAQTPCDDAILQAMTMCYRELHQLGFVSKLYEAAVKADPTNEELHTHLFMSYVRVSDFKQQQQAAMLLYKVAPKIPYYCWAVMSVILQATRGDGASDSKKRALLLSLAERMIDKLIVDNKLEAEQEVQLYVMVLEEQGKHEKILQVLEGPLGSKLPGDPVQNRLPYLITLNRWNDVNLLCKRALSDMMDRWDVWKNYLRSVFELNKAGTNNHNASNHSGDGIEDDANGDLELPDDTAEKAHEFICGLIESVTDSSYMLRGPYLARFELCTYLKGVASSDLLGDIMELFMEYYRKFGHKSCCVSDLRGYLHLLDEDRRLELAEKLIKDVGISSTSVPQSEQQMQRHICALQLSRLCGSHRNLPPEHITALVTAFSYHYLHGHQTYGQELLSTDQAPADSYTLLAAHLLYDLHVKTQSSQPLLLALVLLKHTLGYSPCNFYVKLLALRIYHILGCCKGAHQLYESLDVKHLQLDSLCYLHCARLATTAHYQVAGSLFDATLKFFSTNYKDSSDHLTFSYKFGSFLKLTEFMDFRERMNNSLHYTTTAVDSLHLSLVQCAAVEHVYALETSPREDPVDWDNLRNNSDLSVYISWDPERGSGPIEEWPQCRAIDEQDVELLRLRVAALDCVQAALAVLKTPSGEKPDVGRLESEAAKWSRLDEDIRLKKHVAVTQRLLCMPFPSRLHSHLDIKYPTVLLPMLSVVTAVVTEDVVQCERLVEIAGDEFSKLIGRMCALLETEQGATDVYMHRRGNLETLCNAMEVISIASLLAVICLEVMRNAQGGKKSKKKSCDSRIREPITNLVAALQERIAELDASLKQYADELDSKERGDGGEGTTTVALDELTEKLATLNLCGENENYVIGTLTASHKCALSELRSVLKCKLKLLSGR